MAPASLNHRYLTEDVPTGLVPLVALGDLTDVPMPISQAIVRVASTLLGRDFWVEGRNLERLGLAGMRIRDVQALVEGEKVD